MIKLCFGSLVKALLKCSAPTTTQKELCGQLLLSIDRLYDITTDDTSASKLANGFQNVPKGIAEAVKKCNPNDVLIQISKRVLPLLDNNKRENIIKVLKKILLDDEDIAPSTIMGFISNDTKEQIISSYNITCEKIITILLLYSVVYTKNGGMRESINDIDDEYISASIKHFEKNPIPASEVVDEMQRYKIESSQTPLQKVMLYLRCPENWEPSESSTMDIRYNKYAPEYTIEHTYEAEDGRDGFEYYLFSQTDPTPHWAEIRLKYHQTVLYHTQGVLLDGGRYFTPCPEWGIVHPFHGEHDPIVYKYLIKDSCQGIIQQFYYNRKDPEECYAYDRFMESILFFSSKDEHERFSEYADYRWDEYEKKELKLQIPYIKSNSEKATCHYENEFRNVRLLQAMYRDFILKEYPV